MRFVQRALNSVTKCELTKCFVFPTWPVTSGFLGTASLQILNWALVLYKGTLHVPALKNSGGQIRNLNALLCHSVTVSQGRHKKIHREWPKTII